MRIAFPLCIAALLLVATGCGAETKTVIRTVSAAPATTTATETATVATTASTPSSPPDCQSFDQHKEGRCATNGLSLVVANRGHEARLHTLAATLNGCRTTQSVSDGYGQSATAAGIYVICSLTVRNRADGPESFGDNGAQTLLLVDRKRYTDAFDAENQADQQSFVSQDGDLQPGLSRTGDVIFDVPQRLAGDALTRGSVLTVDFGTDPNSATAAAVLRTYN